MSKRKIGIICGGPSAERGISMNSARSLFDNLDKKKYDIDLIYFNPRLEAFEITPSQIYSNTPLDFDYKLHKSGKSLSQKELATLFLTLDLVFPAIHGFFGEDGQLQSMLDELGVKYVGSGAKACYNTSNKHECQQILKNNGFFTVNDIVLSNTDSSSQHLKKLVSLQPGKYVVKPLQGGSSIGVEYFSLPLENEEKFMSILDNVFTHDENAIIEPYFTGTEFTIIVLENSEGNPVAILPTEIEFHGTDNKFFNYRKKYLATAETRYHTPARFGDDINQKISDLAEKAFITLGMKDFARIDGWLSPNGDIWFSDINAISGMEQNSFLFQQAGILGLSHRQLLDYIIEKNISCEASSSDNRETIPVIFGGNTAERQVSVMSGTNVWMKLKSSQKYKPIALFLDSSGKIHHIPHFLCLHHTVEEIEEKIVQFKDIGFFETLLKYTEGILDKLGIAKNTPEETIFVPYETSFEKIASAYKFLFLGLHGGDGENGVIQKKLESLKLAFNGPDSVASSLCMDKYLTGKIIDNGGILGIRTANKTIVDLTMNQEKMWDELKSFSFPLILKPRGDGCSAGVIKINDREQLFKAIAFFQEKHSFIPAQSIHDDHGHIELPHAALEEILVEEFITSDKVFLKDLDISWTSISDYIEVTVGVIGEKGNMKAFLPSQTIASNTILSLEEKFMGGTGINLTPPPPEYVKPEVSREVQRKIKLVADILGLEGYSRIDTFMNIKTGDIIVIEANTLPGLTPSTVIYHQALAEPNPMRPLEFLEQIIDIGKKRYLTNPKNDTSVIQEKIPAVNESS